MTPEEAVRGVAGPVGKLGGGCMFDAATHARGQELGLAAGLLPLRPRRGPRRRHPSVVVAAFGFFPPALQAQGLGPGRAALPVAQFARDYAACCADWGRRTFAEVPTPAGSPTC